MTQKAFAHLIGVDQRTVQRWESGESRPSPYMRQRLYAHLGATPADLGLLPHHQEEVHQEQTNEPPFRPLQNGKESEAFLAGSPDRRKTVVLLLGLFAGSLVVLIVLILVLVIRLLLYIH
jgi:transcriptional regulator with XRE-family HTH domain